MGGEFLVVFIIIGLVSLAFKAVWEPFAFSFIKSKNKKEDLVHILRLDDSKTELVSYVDF